MGKRWIPIDEWLGRENAARPWVPGPDLDDLAGDSSWPPAQGTAELHADETARRATDGLDGSGGTRT